MFFYPAPTFLFHTTLYLYTKQYRLIGTMSHPMKARLKLDLGFIESM